MPRPGPRPYECVRRAWHSDRHKPIRGSMIGQILRMAYDTHSAATKGNREWQDKLLLVVCKAEEIMYSKANSEAEYVSQDTLWDRVNDAINTIIRRDESTETGGLLPPCIEAALNLGCKVERASRSQRHNNPRSYLSPRTQEPASVTPRAIDRTHDDQGPRLMPIHSINPLNFAARATTIVNPNLPVSESSLCLAESCNAAPPQSYPHLYENIPPGSDHLTSKEADMHQNFGSVYPLFYGDHYKIEASDMVSEVLKRTDSNTILVGKPIGTSVAVHTDMGVLQPVFSCSSAEVCGSMKITEADFRNIHDKPTGTQCDLSLRLGPCSDPCISTKRNQAQENEIIGSSSSQERDKFSVFSQRRNKEFCFFPSTSNRDPFESCPDEWASKGEVPILEANMRKRKAPFSDDVEGGHFCWQSNQFIGRRIEGPGL
ncbi:COACTIVATOR CBP KIX DOMAIN-CONTAINING PROTEIN-RELATED [Salix purpurea]|uniref:COACTIVATOR CBP KIX DOMAIN-CONTAINING PROTEIN-RELATED n=1 Tax=Salix purpurea TaxID=77065 RepID=A0A9Q0ZEY4_SALPP|nr:COACTIVATOR CBP KIX DOMAIN-CONTAINING PROTEIN-RELATED [Salix purpurea]